MKAALYIALLLSGVVAHADSVRRLTLDAPQGEGTGVEVQVIDIQVVKPSIVTPKPVVRPVVLRASTASPVIELHRTLNEGPVPHPISPLGFRRAVIMADLRDGVPIDDPVLQKVIEEYLRAAQAAQARRQHLSGGASTLPP